MYDFNTYAGNKVRLIEDINGVIAKIKELESLNIETGEIVEKLNNAIKQVNSDKISIVLVGAFSDGKTSVVAGWFNQRLDNMKISEDESSDQIIRYCPDSFSEDCEIVDTPGLFGEKKGNDEKGGEIVLSDITKKYISEANIILYVVAAKNPIKDSHKPCVKWILKDLDKLSSTIFVINKMDYVADLTDREEFARQAEIKAKALRSKLPECGLTPSEAEQAKVVCISAAPYGREIEAWKDYREEYIKRSKLNSLDEMIGFILENVRETIIMKTGCDILNDEVNKIVDAITNQEALIQKKILPEMREGLKRNKKDLENGRKKILRNRVEVKKELEQLENKKIAALRSVSMEKLQDFIEDEIGIKDDEIGYRLDMEINDIFEKYLEKNNTLINQLGDKFQNEYDKQNRLVDFALQNGALAIANGMKAVGGLDVNVVKNAIFYGRDILKKVGIVIKFKPWQVTKLAKGAIKDLPVVGTIIDVGMNIGENIAQQEKMKKFTEAKKQLSEFIKELFYQLMEQLNSDEYFLESFAPDYSILLEQIEQEKRAVEQQEYILEEFGKWKKELKAGELKIV